MIEGDAEEGWRLAGESNHWSLPEPAALIWRLPVIRHIRTIWNSYWVEKHYRHGLGSIGIPTGYDQWVLWAMWRGKV